MLMMLNLRDNALGDDGVRAFADTLHENPALLTLLLSCNGITDSSTDDVRALLQVSTTIEEIDLNANPLRSFCTDEIGRALHINRTLAHISLAD